MGIRRILSISPAVILLVSGCSVSVGDTRPVGPSIAVSAGGLSEVSKADLERRSKELLAEKIGVTPDRVECEGALPAETGKSQRCNIFRDGDSIGMTATVASVKDNGSVEFEIQVDSRG